PVFDDFVFIAAAPVVERSKPDPFQLRRLPFCVEGVWNNVRDDYYLRSARPFACVEQQLRARSMEISGYSERKITISSNYFSWSSLSNLLALLSAVLVPVILPSLASFF